jgi:hypothetical protein
MSTATVEVRPAGAKAGQPTYQINATVSQILGSSVWGNAVPDGENLLELPLMVALGINPIVTLEKQLLNMIEYLI